MSSDALEAILAGPKGRFLLVSDLDWTMVDHADVEHASLLAFNRLWTSRFAADSLLVFSTGRSPELFAELAAEAPLLAPDVLVCSVGTEILVGGAPDAGWAARLDAGWDRAHAAAVAARFPELVLQRASEQRPHKVSFKLYAADRAQAAGVAANLRAQLAAAGLEANVVFSGGEDLDVLPAAASKGRALEYLLEKLAEASGGGAPPAGVLAAGDSGNDVELLAVPSARGCVVANAHVELREWAAAHAGPDVFEASRDGPAGVAEALEHFGLVRALPAGGDAAAALSAGPAGAASRAAAVVGLHEWFEAWFNDTSAAAPFEREPAARADLAPLEAALAEGFELVGPAGAVTGRAQLLAWFRERGRGCRAPAAASPRAGAPAAPPPGVARTSSGLSGLSEGLAAQSSAAAAEGAAPEVLSDGPAGGGAFRLWVDRLSQREVAPGAWLVRYQELQQRFGGGGGGGGVGEGGGAPGGGGGRTARWATAVLRWAPEAAAWTWLSVHETWVAGA